MSVQPEGGSNRPVLTTAVVTGALVVSVMPPFLAGASGVFLRADLGFDEAGLGMAISAFFGAFALTAVFGSRLSERLGAGRALTLSACGSASVLLAIAALASNLTHLVLLLALGGVLNGVAEPATNLAMARAFAERQGFMFGVKQSAPPFVTLLAGASVPLIALTVGWRWAFVGGAMLALLVGILMPSGLAPPRPRSRTGRIREGDAATAPLVAMAVGAGAGTAAAVSLGSFLVESAVAGGIDVSMAGWLLAVASVAGIGARLLVGWLADRRQGIALYVVALMLFAGAGGYAMMATGSTALLPLGTLIAYACGWGWVGLLMYAIARLNPNAPGAATGIVLAGAAVGAAVGPFAFGYVVSLGSFGAAWAMAATSALLSSVLVVGARMWLVRDRDRRAYAAGA